MIGWLLKFSSYLNLIGSSRWNKYHVQRASQQFKEKEIVLKLFFINLGLIPVIYLSSATYVFLRRLSKYMFRDTTFVNNIPSCIWLRHMCDKAKIMDVHLMANAELWVELCQAWFISLCNTQFEDADGCNNKAERGSCAFVLIQLEGVLFLNTEEGVSSISRAYQILKSYDWSIVRSRYRRLYWPWCI